MNVRCVYIVPPKNGVDRLFDEWGVPVIDEIAKADALVFTGGADVSPSLYLETTLPETHSNPARDAFDTKAFAIGMARGIPMIGICRGGQFLNVMAGGKLWQDVDKHAISGTHPINVYDLDGKLERTANVTSTHHQMMRPGEGGIILGSTNRSTYKKSDKELRTEEHHLGDDIEIVWYPEKKIFCFQPHPEYDPKGDTAEVFFGQLNELLIAA